MRHQLKLKILTTVEICDEICVVRAGIQPELTLGVFGHAERMRRERIIGWTSAELPGLGLTAVGLSKPKAWA
jgi:hypothetical protein